MPRVTDLFRRGGSHQKVSIRIGSSSVDRGRYYCDGAGHDSPDCLQPRPVDAMQFGCAGCGPGDWKPFDVWLAGAVSADSSNAGREQEIAAMGKDPSLFAKARPFRCKHALKTVVRCPACQKVVDLKAGASPIAFVGGVRAGKSVLSGVLAHELCRRDGDGLFARTGLSCRPRGSAHRQYETEVVNPLIERGELPRKTWMDEYHKAVYLIDDLRCTGWASRSILFTDVAGEVYDDAVTPAIAALRTILLWARELVLVVDPGNNGGAGGIGGRQAPDLLDVADRIAGEVLLPTGQTTRRTRGRFEGRSR